MKREKEACMKRVEEEILLLVNHRLFLKKLISKEVYERTQECILSDRKEGDLI